MTKTGPILFMSLAACCANLSATQSSGVYEWQKRRIFHPTTAELRREARGRVVIYDGMRVGDVRHALDSQFDRIDNMMFIRTRYPNPKDPGAYLVEDDDCE
jgi:hypothetical protein